MAVSIAASKVAWSKPDIVEELKSQYATAYPAPLSSSVMKSVSSQA
jgi:hypothetical protein